MSDSFLTNETPHKFHPFASSMPDDCAECRYKSDHPIHRKPVEVTPESLRSALMEAITSQGSHDTLVTFGDLVEIVDRTVALLTPEAPDAPEAALPPYEVGSYADRNTGRACWSCAGLMRHAPGPKCIYPDAHRADARA